MRRVWSFVDLAPLCVVGPLPAGSRTSGGSSQTPVARRHLHLLAMLNWARRCLVRVGGRGRSEDSPYRSPQEIALRNAADALGVTLGEYYPDDGDLPDDLRREAGGGHDARSDAMREEMLVHIERLRASRKRRSRRRALRIGVLGAVCMAIAV